MEEHHITIRAVDGDVDLLCTFRFPDDNRQDRRRDSILAVLTLGAGHGGTVSLTSTTEQCSTRW